MDTIDCSGLDKSSVLAALYNGARPQGMGFLQYEPEPMSPDEAASLLQEGTRFDYLKGRVMKVDLVGDDLDPRFYDRDNGADAALIVIETLRATGDPNNEAIRTLHQTGRSEAAKLVRDSMEKETTILHEGGVVTMTLGLRDVADKLGPAVDKATDR